MKSFALNRAGITDSGVPAFHFSVELRQGADLDGKFDIQFGAAKQEGSVRLVINSPRGVVAVFSEEASVELADALADTGEYIVIADYENVDWEEYDAQATILLGRDFGAGADYREKSQFSEENLETIRSIRALVTQERTQT
jgi:hypothetical protein